MSRFAFATRSTSMSIAASLLLVAGASFAQAPAQPAPVAPPPAAPAPAAPAQAAPPGPAQSAPPGPAQAAPAPAAPAPAAPTGAPPAAWTEEPAPPAPVAPADAAGGPSDPAAVSDAVVPEGEPIDAGGGGRPADAAYTPEPPKPLPKYDQWNVGFEVGVRNVVVGDVSYDPYSGDDLLTSFALAATWMPLQLDILSLGLVGEWNPGGSSGDARGDATSLTIHRASIGAQGRLALGRRVYLSAKVAPSLLAVSGDLEDPAVDRPLEASDVTWGLDAVGGAAVLIARAGDPDAPAFRLWIVGEVGYAFSGTADMTHTPGEVDDDPRRYGGVALAALDTSGVVNRFGVAMTF